MSWKAEVFLLVWKKVGGCSYVTKGWNTVPTGEAARAAAARRASWQQGAGMGGWVSGGCDGGL